MQTTIVAISSPPGAARRGILRLSGADTRRIVNAALHRHPSPLALEAGRCVLHGSFDDGVGLQPVSVFWMPGPASYTREDVAEFHLPGSPPLLAKALERLIRLGATAAQPGEFTRRAFLNGRLDLSQAEGVLSLVEATNEAERRAATSLLDGGLGRRVQDLRDRLDDLRALCEASLDFDEADTGHVPTEELVAQLDGLREDLERALSWEVARQPPTALPRVLFFGAPNAGKSSLFNRLVPDGSAIVSVHRGTTRDAPMGLAPMGSALDTDVGSAVLWVTLQDAPGLDPEATGPDATAQRLAEGDRRAADLMLWTLDLASLAPAALRAEFDALPRQLPVLLVANKSDQVAGDALSLLREALRSAELENEPRLGARVVVSAQADLGMGELRRAVRGFFSGSGEPGQKRPGGLGRELFARHRRALEAVREVLEPSRLALLGGAPLDQVAENLRSAGRELDEISGATTVEDVLDRIFARFCIGK